MNDFMIFSYLNKPSPPPFVETIQEGVLTPREAYQRFIAEVMHVDYTTFLRKIRNKEIPAYRIGRLYRIPKKSLERYIEASKPP